MYFDPSSWSFTMAANPCAEKVFYFGDFIFVSSVTGSILLLDTATFIRLRILSSRLQRKSKARNFIKG